LLTVLNNNLSKYGLLNRGGFNLQDSDLSQLNQLSKKTELKSKTQSLIMVGVAGSEFWPIFQQSKEYTSYLNGETDPLDRWSKRIGDEIASEFSGQAVYPFEGPPHYPFIEWAKRCDTLHSSKMGFSIHPEYGLWHAFRFALLLPNSYAELDTIIRTEPENACATCVDSPCLNSCPVAAYSKAGFDPDSCFQHLQENEKGECRMQGCIARRSCPEGVSYQYESKHAEFHMTAFYQSQKERIENSVS